MNKSIIIASLAILAAVGTANAADSRADSKALVGADSTVRQQTGAASNTTDSRDASSARGMQMAGTAVGMGWAGSSTATN